MSKLNPPVKSKGGVAAKSLKGKRLAGGFGAPAAKQDDISTLRRLVLANLLWENLAYVDGKTVSDEIAALIPKCDPEQVALLAIEARQVQKLRSTPLFILAHMLKHEQTRGYVAEALPQVATRPDMMTDFLALYFQLNKAPKGKSHAPIAAAAKKGLAAAFNNFSEYQFAKYDRDGAIKLRDVMFLTRPVPEQGKEELFKKIADRTLTPPDTWEVALSSGANKKDTWTRLIDEGKLGALAYLRNLRNMKDAKVDASTIRKGLKGLKSQMLLPVNFLQAAIHAPEFESDINDLMLRMYSELPKLPGKSIVVVDVSGSMGSGIGGKSTLSRLDAGAVMAMLALELCEEVTIYLTAGSDGSRIHQTAKLDYPKRGFGIINQIKQQGSRLGGGGIFTRQCLEFMKKDYKGNTPDRIIIFSDSQDCDTYNRTLPSPFGKNNYIVDVSAHKYGVNYKGVWTAEISGFSEHFLTYIAAYEGLNNEFEEE